MDKASAYRAGDCRFESCRGHDPSIGDRTCEIFQVCKPCSNQTIKKLKLYGHTGIEPRAFGMRSGCDTTTTCALDRFKQKKCTQTVATVASPPDRIRGCRCKSRACKTFRVSATPSFQLKCSAQATCTAASQIFHTHY